LLARSLVYHGFLFMNLPTPRGVILARKVKP